MFQPQLKNIDYKFEDYYNKLPLTAEDELETGEAIVREDDESIKVEEYIDEDPSHRQSSVVVTLTKFWKILLPF